MSEWLRERDRERQTDRQTDSKRETDSKRVREIEIEREISICIIKCVVIFPNFLISNKFVIITVLNSIV